MPDATADALLRARCRRWNCIRHLLGTVRRRTFEELARRGAGAAVGGSRSTPLHARREAGGQRVLLRALDRWLPLTRPDDFHRPSYEYLQDAAHTACATPSSSELDRHRAGRGSSAYATVRCRRSSRAIADAQTDFGVIGWLVSAIDRAELTRRWRCCSGCSSTAPTMPGIGIDSPGGRRPAAAVRPGLCVRGRAGLKTTAHAGEFGLPAANVRCAIDELRVDRIDHGCYTIVDDPALTCQALAWHGLTVVPTTVLPAHLAAWSAGAAEHLRSTACASRACACTPNTDDPIAAPRHAEPRLVDDGARLRLFDRGSAPVPAITGWTAPWIDRGDARPGAPTGAHASTLYAPSYPTLTI